MRSRPLSLLCTLVAGLSASSKAQACLGTPEYAPPAFFVGAVSGLYSTLDGEARTRPVSAGLTARASVWSLVGSVRVERIADPAFEFYGDEGRTFRSEEASVLWNFDPDGFGGMRLCPLIGYGRRLERRYATLSGDRQHIGGARESRSFAGVGVAAPIALSADWTVFPGVGWRRERIRGRYVNLPGGTRYELEADRFDVLTLMGSVAFRQTLTLTLEAEGLFSVSRDYPYERGLGDPGSKNFRATFGYHFASRGRPSK